MFKCFANRCTNKINYPCLMRSTRTGSIYLMALRGEGTCLRQGGAYVPGEYNSHVPMESMVLHNEPVTLENV